LAPRRQARRSSSRPCCRLSSPRGAAACLPTCSWGTWASACKELTNTKDKKLQGDIIGALAYLGDPKALPLIQDRLDPNSKDDYRREIRALARLGTEEAEKTAVQFVRSIPEGKRFYRHAAHYVRSGGGNTGVQLIKERVQSQPDDPEVQAAIGTLRRYPTEQSHETLVLISQSVSDPKVAERAANAAADVDRKLKGIIPEPPK
jgi:HEAT repeat protein